MVGACAVMVWRLRETQKPISLPKIVIPPLAMSTGFGMFFYPPMRVPLEWATMAFLLGAVVFSYPLIRTSKLSIHGDEIFLRRSKAFMAVLIALVAVRLGMRQYVQSLVSPEQTAALFYLLAFGMIVRWRSGMFFEFRRLQLQIAAPPTEARRLS
jgi:membrane protein CcdC involved in cytochrome C biogenesis